MSAVRAAANRRTINRGSRVVALAAATVATAVVGSPVASAAAAALTGVDLSTYARIGRYDLPEPTRTTAPADSLLAQEASAVTYDRDTDSLFVVGDGGTSITQVDKTGNLIDSMTLARGDSPQGTEFYDTEGIAYVGGGRFVLTEERDRQANLFTYVAGATLNRADVQTVKLGTTIDNIGIEGITNDPQTGGFIAVKETGPEGIFQTDIDFAAGTATNGSATTENSTNLFDPALAGLPDFSDVFALSNLSTLTGPDTSHLLVLSQEGGRIVNVDRSGSVASALTIIGDGDNPLSVPDQSHEGLAMDDDGHLYVVSEGGGGDVDHPQMWVYAPSTQPNQAPTAVTLTHQVSAITENTNTTSRLKVADVDVSDDGLGTNGLTLTGPDAGSFVVDATGLYLKPGTVLDYEAKTNYKVSVVVDDPAVGATPDATSAQYTLQVTDVADEGATPASLTISEVSPWSSGDSPYGADWFEVTNTGAGAVDLTGWKMDDNSNSFGSAVALNGVASLAPGTSAIFLEGDASTVAAFTAAWFAGGLPNGVKVGSYSGGGVGLSTGGDAVNLFDSQGNRITGIAFGTSTSGFTFDNAAGAGSSTLPLPTVSTLSKAGINGARLNAGETGSPGTIAPDTLAPTVTYSGNAGTYTVDQTIAITCAAADEPRGSGIASSTCANVTAAADAFGLGTHSFSATATDNAGNVGTASGSFTVVVTSASLCKLTRQMVDGSAKYQGLTAKQKAVLDKTVDALCAGALTPIKPTTKALPKAMLVTVYKLGVAVLAADGYLTKAQATELGGFASRL